MIKLSKPFLDKKEAVSVLNTLHSGNIASNGAVHAFEGCFAKYIGTKYAIATSNGTTALHTALLSLGIKKGDLVLTTPFSFIATSNSILYCGAKPVFCDIDKKTFNISADLIEQALKKQRGIKAILIVHLYGLPCEMDRITRAARKHNVFLVEDCAQAAGAEYDKKRVGSFGDISIFSFYATKNMTTAEGGMIVTDRRPLDAACRAIINHGRVNRFYHTILGYNYRLTDIAASIGICQLKKLDRFNALRNDNAAFLSKKIDHPYVETPSAGKRSRHVWHQYTIKVKKGRDSLARHLYRNGIDSAVIYPVPIHKQPLYRKLGLSPAALKGAESAARHVLSIPVHPGLSRNDLSKIAATINGWKPDNE